MLRLTRRSLTAVAVRVVKATLADIKPGSFVGIGAMPQADGTQRPSRSAV
jgi:hypothetical protein